MAVSGDRGGDVNALAASLRSHSDDISLYAGMLLSTLSEALPPHMTQVQRERGLRAFRRGDRPIRSVTITVGDRTFRLTRDRVGAVPAATVDHVVRGIVLSTDEVPLTQWTDLLAQELAEAASSDAGVAEAISALISGAR